MVFCYSGLHWGGSPDSSRISKSDRLWVQLPHCTLCGLVTQPTDSLFCLCWFELSFWLICPPSIASGCFTRPNFRSLPEPCAAGARGACLYGPLSPILPCWCCPACPTPNRRTMAPKRRAHYSSAADLWPACLVDDHSWGCSLSTPLGLPTTSSCMLQVSECLRSNLGFLSSKVILPGKASHGSSSSGTISAFREGLPSPGPGTYPIPSALARSQVLAPLSFLTRPQAPRGTLWLAGL